MPDAVPCAFMNKSKDECRNRIEMGYTYYQTLGREGTAVLPLGDSTVPQVSLLGCVPTPRTSERD